MNEGPTIDQEKEALEQFILNNPDLDKLEGMLSDFNVFETLNMVNAEIRHSNMLAWLFEPRENHGLGAYFIHNFLKAFVSNNKSSIDNINVFDLEMLNYSDVEVRREYKNIDLLILINDEDIKLLIAIENKVLSSEHSNQLTRYYNDISEEFTDYKKVLIFLSPEGTFPKNENWIPYDYNGVIDIIDSVLEYKKDSISEPVAEFIYHYNTILKRYFMGNSEIEKICKNIYKKHSDALDLIFQYKPDIMSEISEYVQEIIKKEDRLIFDSAGKTVIRFATQTIDQCFPKISEGWLKSKRIVAYEFYNYEDKLILRLYLGPGDQKFRQKVFELLSQKSELFNYAKGPLYTKHNCVYQTSFLAKKDVEQGDIDIIKEKIDKKWQKFLEKDMVDIDKYVMENWDVY